MAPGTGRRIETVAVMTAAEYRQTFSAAEWRQLAGDRQFLSLVRRRRWHQASALATILFAEHAGRTRRVF